MYAELVNICNFDMLIAQLQEPKIRIDLILLKT